MECSNAGYMSKIENLENLGSCVKNNEAIGKKRKRECVDDDRQINE